MRKKKKQDPATIKTIGYTPIDRKYSGGLPTHGVVCPSCFMGQPKALKRECQSCGKPLPQMAGTTSPVTTNRWFNGVAPAR